MAITYCEKLRGKRSASISKDSVTRSITYLVKCDSGATDTPTIELAPSVAFGSAHPSDSTVFVSGVNTTEVDANVWTVEFTYTSPEPYECENPLLNCDPIFSWSTEKEEEIFKKDVADKAVVNSAGDQFAPLPTRLKSRAVLTIEYNRATFSGAVALALDNLTNSDTFEGAAPHTLLLSIESATQQWHKICGFYWKIRIKLTYNPDKWTPIKILDSGSRQISDVDPTKKELIKIKGREVTSPVPLKDGKAIEDPTQDPEYLEFEGYDDTSFHNLFYH